LARALNIGLEQCRHELVARMDSDDVAMPDRLERQVAFMTANRDIAVSSAWVAEKDEAMAGPAFVKRLPTQHAEIAAFAKRRNPINHPVSIYRKQAVLAVGGYPTVFPEDYALWALMLMRGYQFANLPQVLLDMRTGTGFIERRGLGFLRREISLVRFQRTIGFFNRREAAVFFAVRAAVRLPPASIRKLIYRYSR
jgi:glycosyltransferase involved in cell wall biosynthesis